MNKSIFSIFKTVPKRLFIWSLSKKIFVLSFFMVFFISIIFYLYATFITYPYLLKAEHQKIETIVEFLHEDIKVALDFEAYDNIYSIQKKAISIDGIDAIVIDTKQIYTELIQDGNITTNNSNSILLNKGILLVEDKNSKYFIKRTQLVIDNQNIGYFDVYYSAKNYFKELENYFKFTITVFIIMTILLIVFVTIIKITLYPLTKLAQELKQIDFSQNIKLDLPNIKGNDERSEIIDATKIISKKLNEYIKKLNDVNLSLEKKVLLEVNKNREKDRLMFQQSRLASMGEMIGNIAHQWRQPLSVLSGIIQTIELKYEMNLLDKEFVAKETIKAKKIAHNMSQTIDDFRNFFQPNKTKELFNILDTINYALYLFGGTLRANGIKYEVFCEESELIVYGYSSEFSQVIVNIISNAKDEFKNINHKNKVINILAKKQDDTIMIQICDNAGGIGVEIIDKIFEPYFSTKPQGEGTGLGLYMSRQIIEQSMDGKLEVSNTNIDGINGACFAIHIPSYKGEQK